jgi:catalase
MTLARVLFATLMLAPCAARAQQNVGTPTVDVMNKLWGRHPGIRANHAKGMVVEGTFVPSARAATLSKAPLFAAASVPVTVRFSDSTGLPELPDGAPPANPHGMGIQFRPPGGDEVDVVTNSLAFFPVATGEQFLELLQAIEASPQGAPKPTALDRFMAGHPAAPKAFGSAQTPSSWARETYNGVDAFVFINAAGKRQAFRFRIDPEAGPEHLSEADAAKQEPDFLSKELAQRLASGPIKFRLMAQLANADDPTNDPTKPWPADREVADLGELTLTKAAGDQKAAAAQLRLLPNRLEPGIEMSDDPLIMARVQAYVISFGRRAQ